MKSVLSILFVLIASVCLAQGVLEINADTQITADVAYDRVEFRGSYTLHVMPNVSLSIYNVSDDTDYAGKLLMVNGSQVWVHDGASVHIYHTTNDYYGEIVMGIPDPGERLANIKNDGFIETEIMRNNYAYDIRVENLSQTDGITEIASFRTSGGAGNELLIVASKVYITEDVPENGFMHWGIQIVDQGALHLSPGIEFWGPHQPMDIQDGGEFYSDPGVVFHVAENINVYGFAYISGSTFNELGTSAIIAEDGGVVNITNSTIGCGIGVDEGGSCSFLGSTSLTRMNVDGLLIAEESTIEGTLSVGGSAEFATQSVLNLTQSCSVDGTIYLRDSDIHLTCEMNLNTGSLLSLSSCSDVHVEYVEEWVYGSLIMRSGSVIEGSTRPTTTSPGDRILVDQGGWFGTEQDPGIAPVIRLKEGLTYNWTGITIKTGEVPSVYRFDNADISGIEQFVFASRQNATENEALLLEGCYFHDMGEVLITKFARCDAKPLNLNSTTFDQVERGVIVDEYSNFKSDGCIYADCAKGAITAFRSTIGVGGYYENSQYYRLGGNQFYGNGGIAAISTFYEPLNIDSHSVIARNEIGNALLSNTGSGLNCENSVVYLNSNNIDYNRGHGFIGKSNNVVGISRNHFTNNGGAELFTDLRDMIGLEDGANSIVDNTINPNGVPLPAPPLAYGSYRYANCDLYFLVLTDVFPFPRMADVSGNQFNGYFDPIPSDQPRFYPDFDCYIFGRDCYELLDEAVDLFNSQMYWEAEDLFKEIVEEYPDSSAAIAACSYLFDTKFCTDAKYEKLRDYMQGLEIQNSNRCYTEALNTISRCYMAEGLYAEALPLYEQIMDHPQNGLDSLYAAINVGYCYYKLCTDDGEAPEDCYVQTETIEELVDFIATLYIGEEEKKRSTSVPESIALSNYPNPFNPTTTIAYSLPECQRVEVSVYNIKGQKVRTLVSDVQDPGVHTVTWDGTDRAEKTVASGVYFCKVESGDNVTVRKMLMIK